MLVADAAVADAAVAVSTIAALHLTADVRGH